MNDKDNKDVVEQIFKLINYMGNDEALANRFVEHLRTEHRTLQASFIRTLKMVIEKYADTPDEWTDLRNEGAVRYARKVKASTEDQHIPFI